MRMIQWAPSRFALRLSAAVVVFASGTVVASADAAQPIAQPASSTVGPRADFDNDGFGDLAVGVPGEDLGSVSNAGGVNVLYGASSGLTAAHNQFWSENSAGVKGVAEVDDGFGAAVAAGDFNHDGYSDLAIAAPYDSIGSVAAAGAVTILYGTGAGLRSDGNQVWDENSAGVQGTADPGDHFGFALAARDFNGDGFTDLAIGIPGKKGGPGADTGAAIVLYGSLSGVTATGNQLISGLAAGGEFGYSVAAGNFDGSGAQDLAVGAPYATRAGEANAGSIYELLSTSTGFAAAHALSNDRREAGDRCGTAVVSLNWDNDTNGYADLVGGCPGTSIFGLANEGLADLYAGSSTGLQTTGAYFESFNGQAGAEFGASLAAGDVGSDFTGRDDLVVGEPLTDVGSRMDVGEVTVFYDNDFGGQFDVIFRQGLHGLVGTGQSGDIFGASITTGNFDGDGYADIAVGIPGKTVGGLGGAGGIDIIYGAHDGATPSGSQFWSQSSSGVIGAAEREDFFGSAVVGRSA